MGNAPRWVRWVVHVGLSIAAMIGRLLDGMDAGADRLGRVGAWVRAIGGWRFLFFGVVLLELGWLWVLGTGSPPVLLAVGGATILAFWFLRYRWRRYTATLRPQHPLATASSPGVVLEPGVREYIPNQLRFLVFQRDGFRCAYCGKTPQQGARLEPDHLVPVSRGGRTDADNLITACFECNRAKRAKVIFDGHAVSSRTSNDPD